MDPIETFKNLPPEQQQEIIKQGVKAVDKLSKAVGKIFGYFFDNKYMIKMAEAEAKKRKLLADAKAYEIEKIGDAIRNNNDLPLTFRNDDSSLAIDITDEKQLFERSNLRLQYQQAKKEQNIESVIGKAVLELGDKTTDSTEEVDEDWYTRFFETVEDISDEQVQSLWARILAGEVLRPRTYTYRLLSVLRNISKNELEIILKIAPLVCGDIILNEPKSLYKKGITKDIISILEDMGILKEGGMQIRGVDLNPGDSVVFSKSKRMAYIFINNDKSHINHMIDVFEITETGKKIFELANIELDMEFIKNILEEMFGPFTKLHIFAAEITGKKDENIFVSDNHIFDINLINENHK